jgi:hypothetical protein
MLLVAVGEGPASITILVTLADFHNKQPLTGVAVEDRWYLTHGGYVPVERIAGTHCQ